MTGSNNHRHGKAAANRQSPKPRTLCMCGCGELAGPDRRFISGHNTAGTRLSNYTGRYVGNGYVKIHAPHHPFSDCDGYIAEHRLLVETHLRATQPASEHMISLGESVYLDPESVVHHVDGDPLNNALVNLRPMTRSAHTALHHAQGDIRR